MKRLILLAFGLGLALPVQAAPPPSPPTEVRVGGEIAAEFVAEDGFSLFAPFASLSAKYGRIGLGAPLRLRVKEGPPASGQDVPSLRREDWDTWSDRTRILRFAELDTERLDVRVGELTGVTLGHGSVVQRYYNTLDLDHYRTGLRLRAGGERLQVEGLVSNLIDLDELFAGRLSGKPWEDHGLELGLTAALHRGVDGFGSRTAGCGQPAAALPSGWCPSTGPMGVVGLDLELALHKSSTRQWDLYLDVNQELGRTGTRATSAHLGARWERRGTTEIRWQVEVRAARGRDPGAPFDTLWDVERWRRPGQPRNPPGKYADGYDPALLSMGAMTAVDLRSPGAGALTALVEWQDGLGLLAWWRSPDWQGVSLRAQVGRHFLKDIGDVTERDGLHGEVSARIRVGGALYATAGFGQKWRGTRPEEGPPTYLGYARLGAGMEVAF